MSKNSIIEQENSLDVKYYLFTVLGYWQLFLVSIIISLIVARFMNGYNQKRYSLNTLISVKEESNPLFSSGTYLTFNWGGASDLLETTKITINSRTHNEKVVDSLQFYINYFNDGQYRLEDAYGATPFKIKIYKDKFQLYNKLFKVVTLDDNRVNISFDFEEEENSHKLIKYSDLEEKSVKVQNKNFSQDFYLDSTIENEYFNFFISSESRNLKPWQVFYVSFASFNGTVGQYRNIRITNAASGSSVMRLQLECVNKARIVDYLNTSVKVLQKDKQQQKILYAIKTKTYIDTLFARESRRLNKIQRDLVNFKVQANSFDLSSEGAEIFNQTKELTTSIIQLKESIDYLNTLQGYLKSDNY